MKKVFISFLIMTFMLTPISLANISSVQAATNDAAVTTTDDTIKISLKNIRDIMIDNNLNIKNLNNAVEIADKKYDYAKDAYEEAKDDYDDAKADLAGLAPEDDTTDAESNVTSTKSAYNSAKNDYDSAKTTLINAKREYENGVEDKVYSAESSYLDYLYNLAQEQLQEDTVKLKEKDEGISKIKYQSGFMSKNDFISSQETNTDSNNALKKLKDNLDLLKLQLYNTLGIDTDEKVTFETDITEDFNVISKINYSSDLSTMFDNNLTLKVDNDAIDDLEDQEDDYSDKYDDDDIYDYTMENKENTLKNDKNTAETSFKSQYNMLMNSYNSIKSSYDKIIQEQEVYKTTQTKFDYGFISKNDLDAKKLTFDTDMATFIKDRNACYLQYLKYIQMKEGY